MRVGIDARWNHHAGVGVYLDQLLTVLPPLAAKRGIEIIAYENESVDRPFVRSIAVSSGRYSARAQYELVVRTSADKIDLLHCPFYWMPLFTRCPVVVTIHDVMPFLFPLYGFAHQTVVKTGYRIAAMRSRRILAISKTTKEDIVRVLKVPEIKVSVVYNGSSSARFHATGNSDERAYLKTRYGIEKPYVLTMSASNWKTKNLRGALEAIERARDLGTSDFQTVIIGSTVGVNNSGMKDSLRKAIITGMVPAEDLPILYRQAAVFITSSLYEGFGLPLLEAMLSGVPSITSMGGSLPEVAGDGALVRDMADTESVATTLRRLLDDPQQRQELSIKAIERASEFTLESFGKNTLDVYESICGG